MSTRRLYGAIRTLLLSFEHLKPARHSSIGSTNSVNLRQTRCLDNQWKIKWLGIPCLNLFFYFFATTLWWDWWHWNYNIVLECYHSSLILKLWIQGDLLDFQNKVFLVVFDIGDWMCPVNKGEDKKKKDVNKEEEEGGEPKGDPEMAPIYLKRLLPVFAQTFQQTMLPSIRWGALEDHQCQSTFSKKKSIVTFLYFVANSQ